MPNSFIPTISDICRDIDAGKFLMEEDEMITFYACDLCKKEDIPSTASLREVMFLHQRRRGIFNLLDKEEYESKDSENETQRNSSYLC